MGRSVKEEDDTLGLILENSLNVRLISDLNQLHIKKKKGKAQL